MNNGNAQNTARESFYANLFKAAFAFTLRTYTHATRQMQQKAAEKMGSFMAQVM